MKKTGIILFSLAILFGTGAQSSYAATPSKKVWWSGVELKLGQIGLLTVLSDTTLYKITGNTKTPDRTLKAGETYRIYNFKSGYLGLGGGYYVTRDNKVKYQTPSKAKLQEVKEVNMQVVGGIKVRYGKHTYASNNQAEYDKVMQIVDEAIKRNTNWTFGVHEYGDYFIRYLNGARWSGDMNDDSDSNRGLYHAENKLGDLVKAGVSKDQIAKVYKAIWVAGGLLQNGYDPLDGSPRSAYDLLVRGLNDCDSQAQTQSAVLDALGFTNAIVGGNNHANIYVKLNSKWFLVNTDKFENSGTSVVKSSSWIISSPTDGSTIK